MGKSKVLCAHCDTKITSRHAFCPNCSQPTMFATVEQRTEWELAQWSQKRSAPRKKVVAHTEAPAAKKHAPVEQPAPMHEVASIAAPRMRTPIKRVQTPKTIHPAVAASRAARQAAAATAEPVRLKAVTPMPEKRVIVLPEAVGGSAPVMKKPARAVKKAAPVEPPKEKTVAKKPPTKATPKKAPKMAPMPLPTPETKSNGNGHASNGHTNGNGVAHDATAEQTEILRELLRRVTAIEEKMPAMPAPRERRFRLRKR